MSLIKKSSELIIPETIKMMIYGQAGMGKTTLALSAPAPLLIDFDGGVKRVNLSHLDGVDIVQVTNWQEVNQLFNEDLTAYQSVVVDTIGKMMDFIISCLGVLIFTGLTAYDTQKLRRFGEGAPLEDGTAVRRGAIMGALTLYLDFINLFLMLLRLFGGNRN